MKFILFTLLAANFRKSIEEIHDTVAGANQILQQVRSDRRERD